MPILEIRLDRAAAMAPAILSIRNSLEAVAISLRAIEETKFSEIPPIPGASQQFSIGIKDESEDVRRQHLRDWLLTKGVQEISRGLRATLEEAYLYVSTIALSGIHISPQDFQAQIEKFRQTGNKLKFPQLLEEVDSRLSTHLKFSNEFLFFQKVRNCFEHRNGIVGSADVAADGLLTLSLPRLGLFAKGIEGDIEIGPGFVAEKDEGLFIKQTISSRSYRVGERLTLTPAEFVQIAQGCWLFLNDLESKLPMIVPATATT